MTEPAIPTRQGIPWLMRWLLLVAFVALAWLVPLVSTRVMCGVLAAAQVLYIAAGWPTPNRGKHRASTIPVPLADGSTPDQPTYKWPSTTGSTDDR